MRTRRSLAWGVIADPPPRRSRGARVAGGLALAAAALSLFLAVAPDAVVAACAGASSSCAGLVRLDPSSLALPLPVTWLGAAGGAVWGLALLRGWHIAYPIGWLVCGAELYLAGVMLAVHRTACPVCLAFGALLGAAWLASHSRATARARIRSLAGVLGVAAALGALHPPVPPLDVAAARHVEGPRDARLVLEMFVADGCRHCDEELRELRGVLAERAGVALVLRHPAVAGSADAARAARAGVYALPTVLVFEDGRPSGRSTGRNPGVPYARAP